jgi:hypothetical protein
MKCWLTRCKKRLTVLDVSFITISKEKIESIKSFATIKEAFTAKAQKMCWFSESTEVL